MCARCSTLVRAFGLRDPLPPTIASLDAETTILSAEEDNDGHLLPTEDEPTGSSHTSGHIDFDTSSLPDGVNPVWQAPASPPSMNNSNSNSNNSNSNSNNSNSNSNSNNNSRQPAHAVRDLSEAPTAGSPICPKRSDVADLFSEAVEPSSTTAKLENPNTSVLTLIMEHADILDLLMLNCPDFPTLFALITSCKTAKHAFEEHPQGIIKALLQTMPQELQYLTVALIGINGCNMKTSYSVKKNMQIWLGKGPKPLRKRLQVCSPVLKTDASSSDSPTRESKCEKIHEDILSLCLAPMISCSISHPVTGKTFFAFTVLTTQSLSAKALAAQSRAQHKRAC